MSPEDLAKAGLEELGKKYKWNAWNAGLKARLDAMSPQPSPLPLSPAS